MGTVANLRKRISDLETANSKLKTENAELKKNQKPKGSTDTDGSKSAVSS